MAHKRNIIIGIALLLIGIAIGYYITVAMKAAKNFDWKDLSLDQSGKGYEYSSEALFNSDIPLPEIKKISGKCKFISTSIKLRNDELNLGYIVTVDIAKLDLQKVPQKYKVEKNEKYTAGEFAVLPIEEVVYSVTFEFKLQDKDGFELLNLKTPPHSIYSGKINEFQDVVRQAISPTIAERVSGVILSMTVEKCETCK